MMKTAKIAEIFESFQGEGIYQGVRQVFVRFFGCNLTCRFCDTPQDSFQEYGLEELKDAVGQFGAFHSLALTGGEPLCQADFIRHFLEEIQDLKLKVYLETNGTLVDALKKVYPFVNIIAMDLKLSSFKGGGFFPRKHRAFLEASGGKELFVKIVVCRQTQMEEIVEAIDVIQTAGLEIPIVLQPNWFEMDMALFEKLEAFKKPFLERGMFNVRVLAQAHKLAGVR